MIVVDTNVISELTRPAPDDRVVAWVNSHDDVQVTATTVAELLYGVARLAEGARKSKLASAIREMTEVRLGDKVIAFDRAAASRYAEIVVGHEASGRPISVTDAQIAAMCQTCDATLATRNVHDFEGVGISVVNPWTARVGSGVEPPASGP